MKVMVKIFLGILSAVVDISMFILLATALMLISVVTSCCMIATLFIWYKRMSAVYQRCTDWVIDSILTFLLRYDFWVLKMLQF
jgi:hypothetical protein